MGIKLYKPTTPGRRKASVDDFSDLTKHRPEKSLTVILKKNSGRNNQGRITVRHQGGGVKRLYRLVDFKGSRLDQPAQVLAIEYDPNRGPRIALVQYPDNSRSYILAPENLIVGDKIISTANRAEAKLGNRMPLVNIPVGLFVHNVELTPGKGGQLGRGAGIGIQLAALEGRYAQLKMPSGEIRLVLKECRASIGQLSNADLRLIRLGKAGRKRLMGVRPTVKGKNMNPVDHPHGGGEGHSPIGQKRGPRTVYGKAARGVRTRQPDKYSNKFIVQSRRAKKRG